MVDPTGTNDSDGDGIQDSVDADTAVYGENTGDTPPTNTDGVDTPDYIDTDSNNDTTPDIDDAGFGALDGDNDDMIDPTGDTD